jgi:hypothetical protein
MTIFVYAFHVQHRENSTRRSVRQPRICMIFIWILMSLLFYIHKNINFRIGAIGQILKHLLGGNN